MWFYLRPHLSSPVIGPFYFAIGIAYNALDKIHKFPKMDLIYLLRML